MDSPKDGLPESPSKKDHCSKISSIGNHRSNEAGSSLASNRRKCRDPECNGQDYRNKESISEQL